MNKYAIILWILLLPCILFSQNKVRVVDNKGTVTYVDSSKWFKVGNNLFNKNKNFSVGIGVDTTAILAGRLVVKGGGISPLVLQDLLQGTSTDKLLIWDMATGEVKQTDADQFSWLTKGNAGTIPGTNFLGTTDANDLVIKTDNTEQMRVTATGKVGIGISAPTKSLVLSQKSGYDGFQFTGTAIDGSSGGTGFLMAAGHNTTNNKQFWYGDSDAAGNANASFLRILASTSSYPALNAVNGTGTTGSRIVLGGTPGDLNYGIIIGADGSTPSSKPANWLWINTSAVIGHGYRANTAPSDGLLVEGGVGIGTATPNNKLEINQGTNGNSGLRFTGLTNAVAPTMASSKFLTVDANGDVVLRNVGENIVDFNTANPNTGGPTFVPNDIQNPDVTYLSTIDNSTWAWSVGQNKYVPATPTSTAWLQGGNTMAGQQAIGTKNNYDLPIMTNNIEAMRIDASQKVGIGTATPTEKLEVKGTVSANNYTTPVQATATGTSYTWDLNKGATAKWTLSGGNNTLTVSNAKAGMYGSIIVTNTGTSTITFASGSNKVINGGGGTITLTPLAGAVDIVSFLYDGTTFWWTVGNNYN